MSKEVTGASVTLGSDCFEELVCGQVELALSGGKGKEKGKGGGTGRRQRKRHLENQRRINHADNSNPLSFMAQLLHQFKTSICP